MKFLKLDLRQIHLVLILANAFLVLSFIFSEYHHNYLSIWLILSSFINLFLSVSISLKSKKLLDFIFSLISLSGFLYLLVCYIFMKLLEYRLIDGPR